MKNVASHTLRIYKSKYVLFVESVDSMSIIGYQENTNLNVRNVNIVILLNSNA